MYKEFITKVAIDDFEGVEDEPIDYSPNKFRETEEEKKEKMAATGSKATEKKLEDVKK